MTAAVDPSFAEALGVDQSLAQQIFDRLASPDCERWYDQVHRVGYCARPIRLKGTLRQRDGSIRRTTGSEPGCQLLKRCGSRRRSDCPSCSWLYAGDTWQMINAGLCGGRKGVPDTVANHPMALVTLTAPSFGPAHTVTTKPGHPQPCRPRRDKPFCSHSRPLWCNQQHDEADPCVGEPLCPDCYDYDSAVLFNFRSGELWNRFCRNFFRALATRLGIKVRELGQVVRVSFVKVAEMQRRAVIHFHAIVRLDGPENGWAPPDVTVAFVDIEAAARAAVAKVHLTVTSRNSDVTLRWGDELDVQPICHPQPLAEGKITPEKLSAYLSKYTCKGAGELFGLDGRVRDPQAARDLGASEHLVHMTKTVLELSKMPGLERLGRWVPTLGFAGHFTSKSRQWSVTLGQLRAERFHHCRKTEGDDATDETTLLIGEWRFAGVGWQTDGEALLVREARAVAIEARQYAMETSWEDWAA
jgi:hypothetical protein